MPKTTAPHAKAKSAKQKAGRSRAAATRATTAPKPNPPAKATNAKASNAKASTPKVAVAKPTVERLKAGELDRLVMAYLKRNAGSAPHSPTTIARGLNRSAGAVGNCLVRLTRDRQVREVSERPRRYSLSA
jgi:hypothetical protein